MPDAVCIYPLYTQTQCTQAEIHVPASESWAVYQLVLINGLGVTKDHVERNTNTHSVYLNLDSHFNTWQRLITYIHRIARLLSTLTESSIRIDTLQENGLK